jgi:hypothetical protein
MVWPAHRPGLLRRRRDAARSRSGPGSNRSGIRDRRIQCLSIRPPHPRRPTGVPSASSRRRRSSASSARAGTALSAMSARAWNVASDSICRKSKPGPPSERLQDALLTPCARGASPPPVFTRLRGRVPACSGACIHANRRRCRSARLDVIGTVATRNRMPEERVWLFDGSASVCQNVRAARPALSRVAVGRGILRWRGRASGPSQPRECSQ